MSEYRTSRTPEISEIALAGIATSVPADKKKMPPQYYHKSEKEKDKKRRRGNERKGIKKRHK